MDRKAKSFPQPLWVTRSDSNLKLVIILTDRPSVPCLLLLSVEIKKNYEVYKRFIDTLENMEIYLKKLTTFMSTTQQYEI